jgi:hypothetical protein
MSNQTSGYWMGTRKSAKLDMLKKRQRILASETVRERRMRNSESALGQLIFKVSHEGSTHL